MRSLGQLRPIYFVPRDNVARAVLIPALACAQSACCMVGYFSAHSLGLLAPGLASFISQSQGRLRLVICPVLSASDRKAIESGYLEPNVAIANFLSADLELVNALGQHTLKCLAYLIAIDRVDLKVAYLSNGIFHPKVWLLSDDDDAVAVHGSSNLTVAGLSKNFEQVNVTCSWEGETSREVIGALESEFKSLWEGGTDECKTYDFPTALKQKLVKEYAGTSPPTEEELGELLPMDGSSIPTASFRIPAGLNYNSGDFAHQGRAAEAFANAGFCGILAMATGSGKTITAMVSAHNLFQVTRQLLIVVSAPFLPLISQWCDEIGLFGIRPRNLSDCANSTARVRELLSAARSLRMSKGVQVLVVTHHTICEEEFCLALSKVDVPVLLIADEVHNLGREAFDPPLLDSISYRLGLSATPIRQYDEEGTEKIRQYFGDTVFEYPLDQAIGVCLVPYDYYVHPVELSSDEMDDWTAITEQLKKEAWKEDEERLQQLLQKRRRILDSARSKLHLLDALLTPAVSAALKHTLIYTSDKHPAQLDDVNAMLRSKGVRFHELTATETRDGELTARLIKEFQEGALQVLTAKRVLDEGVNIPQISRAYILASTTVERQWIQRRGRVLRKCSAIGKTHSTIHDFIVLPPDQAVDKDTLKIVKGELTRAEQFAGSSRNFAAPGGPLSILQPILKRFFFVRGENHAAAQ